MFDYQSFQEKQTIDKRLWPEAMLMASTLTIVQQQPDFS